MLAMHAKAAAAEKLRDDLAELERTSRFTPDERCHHLHRAHFIDGTEIFAVSAPSIHVAASTDNAAAIRKFVLAGHLELTDAQGNTALHRACEAGKKTALEELHRAGANVNAKNNMGWSPLHFAVNAGHNEIVSLRSLLSHSSSFSASAALG